jgi:phosphatidylinositol glycan class U
LHSRVSRYLFNPYIILSCLARSTTTLDNTLLLLTLSAPSTFSGALLALATHTSLYPTLLLPALILHRGARALFSFLAVAAGVAYINTATHGHAWLASWRIM